MEAYVLHATRIHFFLPTFLAISLLCIRAANLICMKLASRSNGRSMVLGWNLFGLFLLYVRLALGKISQVPGSCVLVATSQHNLSIYESTIPIH